MDRTEKNKTKVCESASCPGYYKTVAGQDFPLPYEQSHLHKSEAAQLPALLY